MIETYAFLAVFALQILVGSVLAPALHIRGVRAQIASVPAERFAEIAPGISKTESAKRFATRYRTPNTLIAVLGVLLLGALFGYTRRPDSNDAHVSLVVAVYIAYFIAQFAPGLLFARKAARYNSSLKASLADGKRKAVLQRRGLFDFVSPFIVLLALLSYLVFAALVLYIRRHPFAGFGGLTNLVIITLVWAFYAILVYRWLYGRNRFPMATHADRLRAIGMTVRTVIYAGIAYTVFASLELMLELLHLQRWELFALSAFLLVATTQACMAEIPRRPTAGGLGCDGPPPPGARDLAA